MTTATRPVFTEADLRAAAGERSFERGTSYLHAVAGLERIGNQVIATVRGTDDYLVVLTFGEKAAPGSPRLRAECGCPYGQEGFFCKHCVAVGLTVLREAARIPRQRAGRDRAGSQTRPSDLSSWLGSLSRKELLAIVCDQVIEDDDWRRRLELYAASANADLPAISARAASLLGPDEEFGQYKFVGQYGYLEGPESWHYARRVRQVTGVIKKLTETGHPAEAAVIAEQALAVIAESSRHASDRAGVIEAAGEGLVAAHKQACRAAASDPARLAEFLAQRMISGDEIGEFDISDYADLLGLTGLARLRERVTAAWTANPSGWQERQAMERVLEAVGDVDALVEMLSADLAADGLTHLRIVQELDQAGRPGAALDWAERGLREPSRPDPRLADYVVERYRAAGRVSDAVEVRRERFEACPSVATYELLREVAEEAGTWQPVRERALALLRAEAAREPRSAGWPRSAPGSVLIDVLIADGDIDAAWECAGGIASDAQWQRLANLVIETRPADALAVYRRLIEMLKKQTGDGVYERIAQLLVSARACHNQLGTGAAFAAYLRALRDDQKRKRRLIRILDAHQL